MPDPISSLWTATAHAASTGSPSPGSPLQGDRRADVVVVGAGAAGLSIALRLRELDADVLVVERHQVGSGVTGGSTAKVTALHGVKSSAIRRRHGDDVADLYLDVNRTALDDIRATIEGYGIDCGLTDAAAVDYATSSSGRELLAEELASTHAAGLKTELHDHDHDRDHGTELPFPVVATLTLPNQAHLHPRRWCEGLATALGPGRVYESTPVQRVDEDGDGCTVVTPGGSIRAEHAVIATHAPIVDPRYLTVRCQPHRSYALAAQLDGPPPAAMYLSVDDPVRSLRPAQVDGVTYLVVAGEGHPVADERDARDSLATLEAWARRHFPVRSIDGRWAAHDQMPADDLPFVGPLTPGSRRWVATGFQKWGLTTGAVAAAVVGEGIAGRRHPAAAAFDPSRLRSTLNGQLVTDVRRVANRYAGDHLRAARRGCPATTGPLHSLAKGDGVVVRTGRDVAAIHRDIDGELHAVSAVCTHEGCLVRFNQAQTSWDCPCHGSRFSVDGEVLCGPAIDGLGRLDPPQVTDPSDQSRPTS